MGNAGSGSEEVQLCLSFLIRQAWFSMRSSVEEALVECRLSVPQYATLLVLEEQPGVSLSDLARVLVSTRQSVTEMVAGMERDDLVERRRHPTNGRTHQVFLAEGGRKRLAEARPAVRAREGLMEQGLTDSQKSAARAWLAHVAAAGEA
ncbi:MarR family winged helix-turn-helix transcriptional regulator [Kitasatospora sp. NPDC088346]|uniref:MarR family winged helix-turn-helix transcriptional regulator n=1 Tax=Kitasatospora sp. NPDC088346 TaxID=3364073 RepID=UPI00382372C5